MKPDELDLNLVQQHDNMTLVEVECVEWEEQVHAKVEVRTLPEDVYNLSAVIGKR
jgi:hypothetical protein